MIFGSDDELVIGKISLLDVRLHYDEPFKLGQPVLVVREATHAEWEQEAREEGTRLNPNGRGYRYYYEIQTD